MNRRRLVYYILLNIFISACVTGTILYWYDRNLKATTSPVVFSPPPQPVAGASTPQPALSPSPARDVPIEIVSVVGSGNLAAEVVILHYLGQDPLDLTNWQLKDENGNIFLFPSITLTQNGAVQVHTAAGTNTVVDLYWNMPSPVWKSGETASLYDPAGNLIVRYRVP